MTPWRVSPVGPRHAAVVAEIHDATIGGGWSVASVTRLIALPGTITLLADRPKDIAPTGFALALMAGEVIDLAAIGVLPEGRRAGCGRALLAAVLTRAALAGAAKCLLEVAADNEDAKALYISGGFAQYGTRPAYYQRPDGTRQDALLFARPLAGAIPEI